MAPWYWSTRRKERMRLQSTREKVLTILGIRKGKFLIHETTQISHLLKSVTEV